MLNIYLLHPPLQYLPLPNPNYKEYFHTVIFSLVDPRRPSTNFKPIKTLKIWMTTHSSLYKYKTNIHRLPSVAINRASFYSLKCSNLDHKLYSCNTINKRKSLNF